MPYTYTTRSDGSCCCGRRTGTGTGTFIRSGCLPTGYAVPETLYLCAYIYSLPATSMFGQEPVFPNNCRKSGYPRGPLDPPGGDEWPVGNPCYGYYTQQFVMKYVGGLVWSVVTPEQGTPPHSCQMGLSLYLNGGTFIGTASFPESFNCFKIGGFYRYAGTTEAINKATAPDFTPDVDLCSSTPFRLVFRTPNDTCAGIYVISSAPGSCRGGFRTGSGTGSVPAWYCWHDPDNMTNNRCSQTAPGPGWTMVSGPYDTCAACAGSCAGDTVCP